MTQTLPRKQDLLDNLHSLKLSKKDIQTQINETLDLIAQHCPVKVGDIVTVNGWTFSGRSMLVERVAYEPCKAFNTEYICYGTVLIGKDKKVGKNIAKHYC